MRVYDIDPGLNHIGKVRDRFNKPHLYLRNRSQIEIRKMITRNLMEREQPKSILDIGSGDGSISLQFLSDSTHVTLIDLSENMLSIAKESVPSVMHANVDFIQADITHLHPAPSFDLVLCIGVLAHIPSIEARLDYIADSIMTGGYCILQITRNDNLLGKLLNFYHSLRNKSGYQMNTVNLPSIVSACKERNLSLLQNVYYASLLPGMGSLPDAWLFQYQKYTINRHIFSWINSEAILLFRKDA